MFNNAKNGCLEIDGTTVDYVSFGEGEKTLVMIPGLGDGLKNARGMAVPFSIMYREYGEDRKVYVISRKNELTEGYTTEDMAADVAKSMDMLGIERADVIGISQGGMIAQHFAADIPEKVEYLVLVVTAPECNEYIDERVTDWIDMAERDAFEELLEDNVKTAYTEKMFTFYKTLIPAAAKIGHPGSYEKFIIMAEACKTHNSFHKLDKIKAPVIIVGGERDIIVGADASRVLADNIKGSRLVMYHEYGHSVFEEAKDLSDIVMDFLNREN